jgi:GH24 family phage-related lysozyme (muramidase)
MINNYQTFLLIENQNWIDSEVNESLTDISLFLKKTFRKMKKLSKEKRKKLLIYAISALLSITNAQRIYDIIQSDDEIKSEISKDSELEEVVNDKLMISGIVSDKEKVSSKFKDPTEMRLSQKGWDELKLMEGDAKNPGKPVLTAYDLEDGRITIGWGHAEKKEKSQYKVGDKITRQEAQMLIKKDAKIAADGVRRIFRDWKKEGVNIKLTQNQFDALISMAFNMGVSGLRNSETIKAIKNGDFKKAGELIKNQNVKGKHETGLLNRRAKESEMFLSYLN